MSVVLPSIHMNGTSKEALEKQYIKCWRAVNNAIETLQQNPPHCRDYYVQNTEDNLYEAYQPAREQHNSWGDKLRVVKKELEELILGIQAGGYKK